MWTVHPPNQTNACLLVPKTIKLDIYTAMQYNYRVEELYISIHDDLT